jgi:hypothetical protein
MGDVVGMTDSDGNLADSYSYSPYGTQTINSQENSVEVPRFWRRGRVRLLRVRSCRSSVE